MTALRLSLTQPLVREQPKLKLDFDQLVVRPAPKIDLGFTKLAKSYGAAFTYEVAPGVRLGAGAFWDKPVPGYPISTAFLAVLKWTW